MHARCSPFYTNLWGFTDISVVTSMLIAALLLRPTCILPFSFSVILLPMVIYDSLSLLGNAYYD